MATLLENRKAKFNFDLMDTYEAGLDLHGFEVKALRGRHGSLEGAHITIRGDEAYLVGMTIPPYQPLNTPKGYESDRHRRLLLNKKEIGVLAGVERQKGLTIVPISVYSKGTLLKLRIAVARGKKKHDKRESMKARDDKRKMERTLKGEY